uniref:Uncharacterized protein n=1 Tax=Anguilla anguilla TaxID=7936 RepID=A0A0E9XJY1_ANGAN
MYKMLFVNNCMKMNSAKVNYPICFS